MKKNKVTAKKSIKNFAWSRKNIVIASTVAAVLVIGTVWGGVKLYGKDRPVRIDLSGKSEEQIRAYMESEEFKKLDREVRHQYGRAAMEQAMEKRMNGFFEVAPEQRTAYLDKMIDEMQERRRQMPPRGAGDRSGEPRPQVSGQNQAEGGSPQSGQARRGGGARRGPEGMRARQERSTPEQRAKRTEFFEAMRNRMKERGLDFRPGGGGR